MFMDKTHFPDWLRLPFLPSTAILSGATITANPTRVPEAAELLKYTSFVPWEMIDQNAISCGKALQRHVACSGIHSLVDTLKRTFGDRDASVQTYEYSIHPELVNAATAALEFDALIRCVILALKVPALGNELQSEPAVRVDDTREGFSCTDHVIRLRNQRLKQNEVQDTTETATDLVTLPQTRIIKPDIILRDLSTDQKNMPFLNVVCTTPGLRFGRILECSGSSLPGTYVRILGLFQTVRHNVKGSHGGEWELWSSLSKAIVYALHTESGCSILTNYNETIFIHVSLAKLETSTEINAPTPKLEVAVSRIYEGNSVFCGLAACFDYVWSHSDSVEFDWVSRARFVERLSQEDGAGEVSIGKRPLTGSEGSEAQKKLRIVGSVALRVGGTNNICDGTNHSRGSLRFAMHHSRQKELSSRVLYKLISRKDEMLSKVGYNRVMKCRLGERPVAVKYFYSFDEKKVSSRIVHEKSVHRLIETRCSAGDYEEFVSALLGYGKLKTFGMILVTAYVGQRIHKPNTNIFVGGSQVEDVKLLSDAAIASLKRIHMLGILHGDVEFRNMRAERRANGEWQVWWIDFGYSREGSNVFAFEKEQRKCRYLFECRNTTPGL